MGNQRAVSRMEAGRKIGLSRIDGQSARIAALEEELAEAKDKPTVLRFHENPMQLKI